MYICDVKGCIESQQKKQLKLEDLLEVPETESISIDNAEVIWPLRKSWAFGMPQGIGYLESKIPLCCDQRMGRVVFQSSHEKLKGLWVPPLVHLESKNPLPQNRLIDKPEVLDVDVCNLAIHGVSRWRDGEIESP